MNKRAEGVPPSLYSHMKQKQFVVPVMGRGWGVRRGGASRLTSVYETKAEAMDAGRQIAKNQHTDLVPLGRDGKIQNPNSYGHDPSSVRDTRA